MLVNIVASSIISFMGTVGNILVITAFFSVRSLRTINNIFVLQLAFVDLMKASIILSTKAINQANGATSMNEFYCQLCGMLRTIGSCQSAVLLAAIAVVRYVKVVKSRSFDRMFTLKKTLIYCGCIFGSTFLLALMPVIGLGKYRFSRSHGACFVNWDTINLVFRSIYYFINVGLTFPILIFCYLKIFRKLREHSRMVTPRIARKGKSTITKPRIQVSEAKSNENLQLECLDDVSDADHVGKDSLTVKPQFAAKSSLNTNESAEEEEQEQDDDSKDTTTKRRKFKIRIKRPKRWFRMKHEKSDVELEVTKVMFAIVIAYTCCWMPAFAINILHLSKAVAIPKDVLLLIVTLVDLKVCLNPLIYGIGSKQFRNAFFAVVRRRFERESASSCSVSGSSKYIQNGSSKTQGDTSTYTSNDSNADVSSL